MLFFPIFYAAVGMVDSVNVIAEPPDILNLPFVGERLRRVVANQTAARYDQKPEDETVVFPIAVPSAPARNYFLFGRPIDTTDLDPRDKAACERVYRTAQQEVRKGIDDLLRAREKDPFQNAPARLAYERLFQRKAPTFPIDVLNR
jgi:hypothetical protein